MTVVDPLFSVRAAARLLVLGVLLSATSARAASTGTASLYMPQGSGAATASGDYVSSSGGLNTSYHYWVEVPPSLGRLRIQVYDADTGTAPENTNGTEGRDRIRNTANVNVRYTVIRPDGTTAATVNCAANGCSTYTAAWVDLWNSTTDLAAGHWEVRVDQSSGITTGDDINGIGIRADDGDATSGGTELNVYVDAINQIGVHSAETAGSTKSYTYYPWITSGCTFIENDFDYDTDNGTGSGPGNTYGSFSLTSRSGSVSRSIASASLSGNDVWKQNTVAAWGTDSDSTDYGIWTAQQTISIYNNGAVNGNYTDVWFGNQSAVTPPTQNPPANSFRLYLPKDPGTSPYSAPAKPYLEQMVRYSGAGQTCAGGANGPNPPARNTTSCYTVTVRLVNPGGTGTGAITFSATNLVTANVPGTRILYEGNASVSQGTITSQPAAAGSGNVTWNPGAVAAGTTALLSYVVRVRPTANGQRNPVTGTVAGGTGTRATYVVHTGNTTQTRATATIGPICELAVTQGTLTQALVSGMKAYEERGAVAVEWETASEAGTLGFYLERFDAGTDSWVRVGEAQVPGLHVAQGGSYRVLDPAVSPREKGLRYRLVEVRTNGERQTRGPFDVAVEWSSGPPSRLMSNGVERAAHQGDRRTAGAVTLAGPGLISPSLRPAPWPGGESSSGVRIGVRETGLQYVSSAALAPLLGETQAKVEQLIGTGQLALTKQGHPVWWLSAPSARKNQAPGLLFYGEGIRDPYAAEEVYRLLETRGPTIPSEAVAAGAGNPASTFPELRHYETDAFPATVLSLDPESDYWFWESLVAGDVAAGSRTLPFDVPGASSTGPATMKVRLQGASSSGVVNEHHVAVTLNGTGLGEKRWTGVTAVDFSLDVPAGLLRASGNQLRFDARLDSGVPFSYVYVNSFDLGYRRSFAAVSDALSFQPEGRTPVTVTGFSGAEVTLLDVEDPLHPRVLIGATTAQDPTGFKVSFTPPGAGSRLLAVGPGGLKVPGVRAWLDGKLRSPSNGADLVIVTTRDLEAPAGRLAEYRRAQGLRTAVVDVEAVMNEFLSGRFSPHAIQDFLAYAFANWHPAPRYVLLAGAGSLDYRNLLGNGDCVVPPIVVATADGLFGSDSRMVPFSAGLPGMAVGRVPAATAAELDGYVSKVIAYEKDAGTWAGSILALADAQDEGSGFAADSDQVLSQLGPGYVPKRIYLDGMPLPAARTELFGGIQDGASFVDYLGHGGLDRLSSGGLFTSADVPALVNGSRLPVMTAMTCAVNRFTVPGFPCLGEKLTTSPVGGAVAVWSPSALSIHGEARMLAARFYEAVDAGRPARLGDLVREAAARYAGAGGNLAMLDIYVLMGDPALLWKAAPPVVPPPGSSGKSLE